MMMAIERIVFAQGDEADEPLSILDTDGTEAAIEYLAQWHHPGKQELAQEPKRCRQRKAQRYRALPCSASHFCHGCCAQPEVTE